MRKWGRKRKNYLQFLLLLTFFLLTAMGKIKVPEEKVKINKKKKKESKTTKNINK